MQSIPQVTQRDVPGIDKAFLAMDTEEGVEVVWNEIQFSQRKSYKAQEVCCKSLTSLQIAYYYVYLILTASLS